MSFDIGVIEPITVQLGTKPGCNQTALTIATERPVPEAIDSRQLLAHLRSGYC